MELPENVVPMPAEQRAELKRLAEAATPGPWRPVIMPHAKPGDLFAVVSDEAGHAVCNSWNSYDACFQAAVSPNVALATLAYVEALETHVGKLFGKAADLQTVINKAIDEYQALAERLADATARATKAESRLIDLLAQFAAGIQPADIASCLEAHSEPAFGEFLRGVNSVHATNLRWVRWKAAEFGLPWPLPAAEFEFGYTPDAAPTPPPSSPAAAGPAEDAEYFRKIFSGEVEQEGGQPNG